MDILDAAMTALQSMLVPGRMMYLLVGVFVGMLVGLMPGLGGLVGMSLLVPFIYGMDPGNAIAMLVGMMAVTQTSDTFVSVLLGVPGSASSQATIMDGYPLAKQGQAGRALGAAFIVSLVGGIVGAIALLLVIPVARPLILSLGSPELFMLSLLGVSIVGVLSIKAPLAGLIAAFVGLLLSAVGPAPTGGARYILFGWDHLRNGIPLMVLALGLFAIPEFITLLRERTTVARTGTVKGGQIAGMRDAWRHKKLVLASAAGGLGVGIVPGVGGSVVDWLLYGFAKSFCRNTENFGNGDIRGVIAPESANNAKEGGALIPTMLFAIPGSGTSAILLGGLVLVGVRPGPSMLEAQNLPLLLTVVWSLALANVVATSVCLLNSRWIVRLSTVRPGLLVPGLTVLVFIAAFQQTGSWGDVALLGILSVLGFWMKEAGWPRAPLLIGVVLGDSMERYLRISVDRYGLAWVSEPGVIALGALLLVLVFGAGFMWWRGRAVPGSASGVAG